MRRVLVHCPAAVGHHGVYVRFLLEYRQQHPESGVQLGLLVPRNFRQWFPEVVALAKVMDVPVFTSLLPELGATKLGVAATTALGLREVAQCVAEFGAEHCLLLHADAVAQLVLPFGVRVGAGLSGILFRPTMHYHRFAVPLSVAERVRAQRQGLAIARCARHSEVQRLFWLDPFGAEYAQTLDPLHAAKHRWLADPLELRSASEDSVAMLKRRFSLRAEQKTVLLFGPPGPRKGTVEALRSLPRLPLELQRRVHLLMIGAMEPAQRVPYAQLVAEVSGRFAGAITVVDEFVSEEDTLAAFAAADVVLLPYQRHVGSSGVLLRAARARKPVVASDYGLVGEWTRQQGLGLTTNSEDVAALANALERAVAGDFGRSFDAERAYRFSEGFTRDAFAGALLDLK